MENKKFWTKTSKAGTYTVVMTAVVLAVLVVFNVLVLAAPSKYTKLDMTSLELYTLSESTEKMLPEIKDEIKIYFLCQGGTDNSGSAMENIPHLTTFLTKYEELCPNLKVQIIDPVVQPTFYKAYSDTELENYTLIIESAKRSKVIDFYDLYFYSVEGYGSVPYTEYQQIANYYMMYGQSLGGVLNFDGESVITNALDYVTTDKIPAVYYLSDHGTKPSQSLIDTAAGENLLLSPLSLRTESLPEDTSAIFLNAPTSDINTDEAKILSDYLAGGGKLIVTTAFDCIALPNLMGVLSAYGMAPQEGIIIETAQGMYYQGTPQGLMPNPSADSSITSALSSSASIFMPLSHGIKTAETLPEEITVTPLFTTSSKAYTIPADAKKIEKTDASVEGQFTVGALAKSSGGGEIVWLGCPAFSDNYNSYVSGGSYKYFLSMLDYLCPREKTVNTIPSTALENSMLIVSESAAGFWSTVLVIILPLAVASVGVTRWALRRRR